MYEHILGMEVGILDDFLSSERYFMFKNINNCAVSSSRVNLAQVVIGNVNFIKRIVPQWWKVREFSPQDYLLYKQNFIILILRRQQFIIKILMEHMESIYFDFNRKNYRTDVFRVMRKNKWD